MRSLEWIKWSLLRLMNFGMELQFSIFVRKDAFSIGFVTSLTLFEDIMLTLSEACQFEWSIFIFID